MRALSSVMISPRPISERMDSFLRELLGLTSAAIGAVAAGTAYGMQRKARSTQFHRLVGNSRDEFHRLQVEKSLSRGLSRTVQITLRRRSSNLEVDA